MSDNKDFKIPADPWLLFREWLAAAESAEPSDPNAMSLATVGAHGMPSARIVLLKSFDESGFVFMTNRESNKGQQLTRHPKAALCFHWKSQRRQVRAEGDIVPVDDKESDDYFATRPRGSQIGAWASQQSRPLASRSELEQRAKDFERKFEDKPVPRPSHWGGFRLSPNLIEFWQDREFRMHDRIVYHRGPAKAWTHERLYP